MHHNIQAKKKVQVLLPGHPCLRNDSSVRVGLWLQDFNHQYNLLLRFFFCKQTAATEPTLCHGVA